MSLWLAALEQTFGVDSQEKGVLKWLGNAGWEFVMAMS
jgi:hypothetical protein